MSYPSEYELSLLEGQYKEILENLETKEQDLIDLNNKILLHSDAKVLLEAVKTVKVKQKKDFILNIINTALLDIFDYDIKIAIHSSDEDKEVSTGKKLKMRYNIILYENGIEIARDDKLLSSNGGGILSIISILLKMLTGYIYSKNKFYIFDESLAQVSEKYQERLSLFLKSFCEAYDFTIILITHNPGLAEHSHMRYVLGADNTDTLKELKIESFESNIENDKSFYSVQIENFQSVKKINMKFSGFVTITGANNIGKSAVVRSINSIIFNDFSKEYLRKNTKQATIKFSKHEEDGTINWAMLKFDGSVVYEFDDGTKLTGKRLAYDKIKEQI